MSKYSYDRDKTVILNDGLQDASALGAIFSDNNGETVKKDAAGLDNLLEQVANGVDTEIIHGISADSIKEAVEKQQLDALHLEDKYGTIVSGTERESSIDLS